LFEGLGALVDLEIALLWIHFGLFWVLGIIVYLFTFHIHFLASIIQSLAQYLSFNVRD